MLVSNLLEICFAPELQIVPSLGVPNFVLIRSLGEKRTAKPNVVDKKPVLIAIGAVALWAGVPRIQGPKSILFGRFCVRA